MTAISAYERISLWNFEKVRSKLLYDNYSLEMAEKCIEEYKKFMSIACCQKEAEFGMSGPVDDVWHAHILDTIDYMSFCIEFAGEYLHHVPATSKDNNADLQRSYARLLSALEANFGLVDDSVWPTAADINTIQCAGCSRYKPITWSSNTSRNFWF